MYSKTKLVFKYIKYWLQSNNGKGHGIHSPFVFEFVEKVLNTQYQNATTNAIEKLRLQLKQNHSTIQIEDFGAGSRVIKQNKRSIATIAKSSLKPSKYSNLLARMVNFYEPTTIVELGTSLGVTTAYMAAANPIAVVYTIEGSPAIAAIAKQNFSRLGLKNIQSIVGNFDKILPELLPTIPGNIDFAFIDGNHRLQPTLAYFNTLLQYANENTIIILDDIHWSEEMEQAWLYVQQHTTVTATIDLFFIGIVVFRKSFKTKQHFIIRY
jgi:predicted O-methyltransferase YrrM